MQIETMAEPKKPVNVFLVYSYKDEVFKQEFEDYLAIMQQNQLIATWVERKVQPGIDWAHTIDPHMLAANLILLMVSPGLLGSGYCSGTEFCEAFERNKTRREAALVPINLYPTNLQGNPLETIAFTPHKPISYWPQRYDAWQIVDRDIRRMIR